MNAATVTPLRDDPIVRDIALDAIRVDQRAQPRDHLNTEITAAYADDLRNGAVFPPLVTFFDGETYWLADGFHRHYAAQGAGFKTFRCEVRSGGLRDAILHSCGANAVHGHRRSNEDKRRAVRRLLEDGEWRQWSDMEVARRCRVSNHLVAAVRSEMEPVTRNSPGDEAARTYTTKHGTTATMDTTNIKAKSRAHAGPKINKPDDVSASDHVRRGIEMERGGMAVEDVAEHIGIGVFSYRQARDIILLAERDDLSAADAESAARALAQFDATAQPGRAYELVQPIVERIWGGRGARRFGGTERKRVETFQNAVSVIAEACSRGLQIVIPHLSESEAANAIAELKEAEKQIRQLRARIEGESQ